MSNLIRENSYCPFSKIRIDSHHVNVKRSGYQLAGPCSKIKFMFDVKLYSCSSDYPYDLKCWQREERGAITIIICAIKLRGSNLPAGFRPPVFAGAARPPNPRAAKPASGLLPSLPICNSGERNRAKVDD